MSTQDPLSAERQRVLDLIDDWLSHYPEDVFPPVVAGRVVGPDVISAHAIRHALRGLREDVEDGDALPGPKRFHDGPMGDGWFYPDPQAARETPGVGLGWGDWNRQPGGDDAS